MNNSIYIHEDYCALNPQRTELDRQKKPTMERREFDKLKFSQLPAGFRRSIAYMHRDEDNMLRLRARKKALESGVPVPFKSCSCIFKINQREFDKYCDSITPRELRKRKKWLMNEERYLRALFRAAKIQSPTLNEAVDSSIPPLETGAQNQEHLNYNHNSNPLTESEFKKIHDPTCNHQGNEEEMKTTKEIPTAAIVTQESPAINIIDTSTIKKENKSPIKPSKSIESSDESLEEGEVQRDKQQISSSTAQSSESDTDDKENEADEGRDNSCLICDKTGHNSFYCQMICSNCSAPYHSYKNCPKARTLNFKLHTFMEFAMKQLMSFNVDHKFSFPMNETTVPVAKKKRKFNRDNAKSGDEETSGSESNEEDESSCESPVAANKSKRRRRTEKVVQTPPSVPFHMMVPGAPFNPILFPYGAPINWINK